MTIVRQVRRALGEDDILFVATDAADVEQVLSAAFGDQVVSRDATYHSTYCSM